MCVRVCVCMYMHGIHSRYTLLMSHYLCCFSTASFTNQDHTLVVAHHLHELLVILPNWEILPLLQDLPKARGKWPPSVLVDMSLLDFPTA